MLTMRHSVALRTTKNRIEGVRDLGVIKFEDANNIIAAHEALLGQVLRQQLEDIEACVKPPNSVALNRLNGRQRRQLKWALRQIEVSIIMVGDSMAFG